MKRKTPTFKEHVIGFCMHDIDIAKISDALGRRIEGLEPHEMYRHLGANELNIDETYLDYVTTHKCSNYDRYFFRINNEAAFNYAFKNYMK